MHRRPTPETLARPACQPRPFHDRDSAPIGRTPCRAARRAPAHAGSTSAGTCHGGRSWGTSSTVFVGRRRLRLWCLVQGLAALAPLEGRTGVAHAAEPDTPQTSIELTYDAPSGCGNREEVVRRVEQLLEGSNRAYEAVRAVVAVRETRAGLRVNYDATRGGQSSKRELVVTDCAAAVEASALLLVLTLDPVLASSATVDGLATGSVDAEPPQAVEPAPEPASAPKPEPKVVPPEPRLSEPSPIEDAPDSLPAAPIVEGGWVGLGGELVTGVSPAVGRGLRLDIGTRVFGARLGVWGAYDWVSDHAVPELGPAANLRSQLMRLRLWGGPVFAVGITRFGPMLSLGVEHLRANVVGIARPAPGHSTWWSASAGGHLDVHFSPSVALRLQAAALLSLERPTFSVRRGPEVVIVHQPAPLGFEASGGLVWVWGSQ